MGLDLMGKADLGMYIRALRKRQGWTQAQLASVTGVAGNTIYRIEAGKQEPETSLLAALLTALGGRIKDVGELLAGNVREIEQLADDARAESEFIARLSDPQRRVLLMRIAELTDDPALRRRIVDYLAGLDTDWQDR